MKFDCLSIVYLNMPHRAADKNNKNRNRLDCEAVSTMFMLPSPSFKEKRSGF